MAVGSMAGGAAAELGLGSALQNQLADETEEEKRRKKLGLSGQSAAIQALMGYGLTGVGAPSVLGMGLKGGR